MVRTIIQGSHLSHIYFVMYFHCVTDLILSKRRWFKNKAFKKAIYNRIEKKNRNI